MIHGDAREIPLRDNSVELCLTDPPYGLGDIKDLPGLLTAWISGDDPTEHVGRGGFMSKGWDKICPPPSLWREVYRVLKPGGYLLCFAGTRTADLIGVSIRLAGFELRDEFSVHGIRVDWLYGSGFPKSTNIGKAIDKAAGAEREVVGKYHIPSDSDAGNAGKVIRAFRENSPFSEPFNEGLPITAPATPEAAEWEGFGTGLKPAHEPILIFRKPIEGTVAENCLKWGTGAFSVDAGRIGVDPNDENIRDYTKHERKTGSIWGQANGADKDLGAKGRFPSNVILVHDPACQRVGVKRVRGTAPMGEPSVGALQQGGNVKFKERHIKPEDYADPDGLETVPQYACSPECPVKELDRQSGDLSDNRNKLIRPGDGQGGKGTAWGEMPHRPFSFGDTGTASRFFKQVEYGEPDFIYCAKESKAMRNAPIYFDGLLCEVINNKAERNLTALKTLWNKSDHYASIANTHCTVKPVELLRYLIGMFSRPGDTVLDPFAGSGSTPVACRLENRNCIGIDNEWEYVVIGDARDTYWANPEVQKAYELNGELPVQRAELPLFGEDK